MREVVRRAVYPEERMIVGNVRQDVERGSRSEEAGNSPGTPWRRLLQTIGRGVTIALGSPRITDSCRYSTRTGFEPGGFHPGIG